MKVHNKMFKIFGALLVTALLFAALPAGEVEANSITSSTIVFESKTGYTLTDNGDGTYSGVIPCKVGGGFDIYAKEGGQAFIDGTTVSIGADHDAWSTWTPDTPDWYQYSLNLYVESGVQKWALRNHAGATAGDPWYEGTIAEPKGVPMSGTMHWGTMYAEETDVGAYLPGTGTPENGGLAETNGGGPGYWDMDWSWGSEAVPLEYPGFSVSIDDLGSGNYKVTLTPAEGPVKNITKGTTYATIQAAIDAASDGDTIEVSPGTYDETLNIEDRSNLTISGVDLETTIIKSSTTLGINVGGYGTDRKTVLRTVNSTGINITGLTFDLDLVKGNNIFAALYWDSTGMLDGNVFKNNQVPEASGGYYEIGVYVRAPSYSDATRAEITISDNDFENMGRVSLVTHDYVDATITGNYFYKTEDDFGYGIELGSASTGTISDNVFYGFDTAAASDGSNSAAIYVENCFTGAVIDPLMKDVTISNNEIYDSQWGVYIGNEFLGYAGNVDVLLSLTGNNIHDNIDGGVVITDEGKDTGSSVSVTGNGNILKDNGDYGYLIFTRGNGSVTTSLVNETITRQLTAIQVEDTEDPSSSIYSVDIEYSNISGNTEHEVVNSVTGLTVNATHNWWGSISGPAEDQIIGDADYIPWCGDAECSFLVVGGSVNVPGGIVLDKTGKDVLVLDGTIIENDSPCFIITVDDVKIYTESIAGGKCVATDGDSGIVVNAGLTDVIIEGLEITGAGGLHGIEYLGNITDLQIVNNFIHGLPGSGVYFGGTVTNNQGIQGNMFKDLDAVAISYGGADLNARYNSWGANAAPSITGVITDPYTFVELEVTPSGALSDSQVAVGDTITYTVMADLTEVTGADFVLKYPTSLLTLVSAELSTTAGGLFKEVPGEPAILNTDTSGEIWFAGTTKDGADADVYDDPLTTTETLVLFTATFNATSTTTGTDKLDLDELTDVFAMFPDLAYSSVNPSNHIYANDLIDGEVMVVELPTITPVGYDGFFAVGVTEQFSLDIDNPTDGGSYANPQLVFDFTGSGYTLEYFDGTNWVALTNGVLDLAAMAPGDYTEDLLFRVSFDTAGSYTDWSVTLYDTDADPGDSDNGFLAEAELGADVVDNYSVIGTFSMQGRTVRSGVLVTLTATNYGPFSGTTVDIITDNLTITGVAEDTYTVTTSQDRYLNVLAAYSKTITVSSSDFTMSPLELRGGNAYEVDELNKIDISDASEVVNHYGDTNAASLNADVNFDGKVNIQDLALVGGNFDLTGADAYSSWTP